jgi:hypothetical protein
MKSDVGIFGRLKKEHSEVSEMLEELADGSPDERRELFPKLKVELLAHAHAEQETLYERLRGRNDRLTCQVEDGRDEHDSMEAMIETLSELDPAADEWVACLKSLEECIDHHVDDEENEMFPAAKKLIDAEHAVDIEREYVEAKSKQMRQLEGGNGENPWDELSKDELYRRAQALGIPGRSQMTKSQLIREIRNHY